jgi:ribosomal protein L37AE/L43A
MVDSLSRSRTSIALLDDEPDLVRSVACPMCHADVSLTPSALAAGGAWRCARCGQHWDADRLTTVAAYAGWVADRDRAD